jgi:hypothetical protein
MHRLRGPPRAYPKYTSCPFCPQFSTPSRDWGPPNSVPRDYSRFYTSGRALGRSPSWSLFRHFGRENPAVMPKKKRRVLLFTVATASPRQNKTKIYKREGSNNEERARDEISDGGRNFGRETKTRRSKPGKHELPVKAFRQGRARLPPTDSALAPRGLHGTGGAIARIRPEPVHAKIECAIAHHCMASPQQMQEKTLRRESQGGVEIVRGVGGRCGRP